jgi:deazaflavin-dependent oxidoreductase (nitroreductase family)
MTAEIAFYKYFVNPVIRTVLRSPLHGLVSGNIAILHFTGRKSGRALSTPLSYTRDGDVVRLLSSQNTRWWLNFRGADANVEIQMAGQRHSGTAHLLEGDSEELRKSVTRFLTQLPRDAKVYGIKLDRNKQPIPESLAEKAPELILVEIALNSA